jgi:phosphoglycerate dehydrogenase-like enzyme
MKIIILTKSFEDGEKLKDSISNMHEDFSSINNYNKNQILSNPRQFKNTNFIFSSWYMPIFTEEEVKMCFPALIAVFYAAGSTKYFAKNFINQGVRVFSAARANAIPVAEFVTAQILLSNKGYFQSQKEYKKPFWKISFNKSRNFSFVRKGNYNARVGIIGCGTIGSKVVFFLKPYKLQISVYDPYISDQQIQELGVKRSSLEDIFINSDVISNHLPDIPETNELINLKLLSLMKESSTFINTGRGSQVNEKDLIKTMRNKPNACALLDVTRREPIFPWSPLIRMKNVFLSPHIAGSLSSEKDRMLEYMLNSYINVVSRKPDGNEVFIEEISQQT